MTCISRHIVRPRSRTLRSTALPYFLTAAALAFTLVPQTALASAGSDTGTFRNPGIIVTLDKPFGSLTITEDMIRAGESEPLQAHLRVDSTTRYRINVEIASDADVDLAGSIVNEEHPHVSGPRDVFLIRVSDFEGSFNDPWQWGSMRASVGQQPPTWGNNASAIHTVQLKVRFSDAKGQYFKSAQPGDYTATVTFEVEPD